MRGGTPSSNGWRIEHARGIHGAAPSNKEKDIPMAAMLQEILLVPDTRLLNVLTDCDTLIEQEISRRSQGFPEPRSSSPTRQ